MKGFKHQILQKINGLQVKLDSGLIKFETATKKIDAVLIYAIEKNLISESELNDILFYIVYNTDF